jgi:hypothetical protein
VFSFAVIPAGPFIPFILMFGCNLEPFDARKAVKINLQLFLIIEKS